MKKKYLLPVCLLLLINVACNRSLSDLQHVDAPVLTQMSVQSVQVSAVGYDHFVATWRWFQTSAYYGADIDHVNYNYLAYLLHAIVSLNPKFEPAYYMSASVFPWGMNSTKLSKPLVMQAMIEFPQDWRWPYYLGFNSYWFEHDDQQAAHFFELSSMKSNAPPLVTSLALRMRSQTGNLDVGLRFLKDLLQQKNDAKVQASLLSQYKMLQTEQQLRAIESLLLKLPERTHTVEDLQQLRQRGYQLPEKLSDGGNIRVLKDGSLLSSHTTKRFKLFVPPKRKGGQ